MFQDKMQKFRGFHNTPAHLPFCSACSAGHGCFKAPDNLINYKLFTQYPVNIQGRQVKNMKELNGANEDSKEL